jgi:protein-S-isoprenylcysteine O-methyltransferase Ste14
MPGIAVDGRSSPDAGTNVGQRSRNERMGKSVVSVAYVLTMIVVIVSVDVLVFRHHFWPRLMVNVGIVLVFGAVYLRFLGRT